MSMTYDDNPLFKPPNPEASRCFGFLSKSYADLYNWSTTHIDLFWGDVWDEVSVIGHKGHHVVDNAASPAANPPWFSEARLNWAENMLLCRSKERIALIQATEPTPDRPNPPERQVTYAELYDTPGDRVASYSSNCFVRPSLLHSVRLRLTFNLVGCIWVSAAADFGADGVLERFEQVQPRIVFAVDAVVYNGKVHPHLPKVETLLSGLYDRGALRPKVVICQTSEKTISKLRDDWETWDSFIAAGKEKKLGRTKDGEIEWCRKGFDWPLWILPIVHRAGGMLLQAKKEFAICADLKPDDVFFYYTTTGWMMWNFLVSGLSLGCTLKVYKPRERHNLSTLRYIYSTGSPLAHALFDYVYDHIHPNVLLASITGGTDICSLFAGMCTALPVYRGEIQCRMLGMAIETFSPNGVKTPPGHAGELVCVRPFPCMPVGFWPLPGFGVPQEAVETAAERIPSSLFCRVRAYHGDHVLITPPRCGNGGGLIMLGRSDGVLNPGGIRFGTSEIYDVLDACFSPLPVRDSADSIEDALAVGQAIEGGTDERVILFVKLSTGKTLSIDLANKIKAEIRSRRSPRHVPARVSDVISKTVRIDGLMLQDIPYTLNGKRVEVPVKKIINGTPVSSINPATLRNPQCLDEFASFGEQLRGEVDRKD
ncbi:hypothetical protein BU15DRAFT_84622 [Melanogaster broomeanus]|nr:hypothetical protein BU15DRAFT_84622 [Melanogaster broomeanus]